MLCSLEGENRAKAEWRKGLVGMSASLEIATKGDCAHQLGVRKVSIPSTDGLINVVRSECPGRNGEKRC
jgi:hypothetical protein